MRLVLARAFFMHYRIAAERKNGGATVYEIRQIFEGFASDKEADSGK